MELYFRTESYILFGILLGIVFINAHKKLDRRNEINRLFLYISLGILIGLTSDLFLIIIVGRNESWLTDVAKFFASIVFIVCVVISYLWYKFVYKWIRPNYVLSDNINKLILIPMIIDIVIIIISPFAGLMFSIDSNNIYSRGPLYMSSPISIYFYLILSFKVLIKNRKIVFKGDFFPLILYGIIPALGGATQLISSDLRLLWPTSAFSIIIVFIYIQQRMMQIDKLTGAWTKSSFEQYLEEKLSKNTKENKFGIIYIDMDDFKNINDSYGHQEGDAALKNAVSLIKDVIPAKDIIARVGGDEFIILAENATSERISDLVDRIHERFDDYNQSSGKKYILNCSFGYDVYDSRNYTISQFINYVDNLMYRNKPRKEVSAN